VDWPVGLDLPQQGEKKMMLALFGGCRLKANLKVNTKAARGLSNEGKEGAFVGEIQKE